MENFAFLLLNLQQHGTSKHVVTDIRLTRETPKKTPNPKLTEKYPLEDMGGLLNTG